MAPDKFPSVSASLPDPAYARDDIRAWLDPREQELWEALHNRDLQQVRETRVKLERTPETRLAPGEAERREADASRMLYSRAILHGEDTIDTLFRRLVCARVHLANVQAERDRLAATAREGAPVMAPASLVTPDSTGSGRPARGL